MNMRTNKNDFPYMVERYVALAFDKEKVNKSSDLPKFDYPKLVVKKLDENRAKELNLDFSRKALVLGCGANYGPAKLWPVEYFSKLLLRIFFDILKSDSLKLYFIFHPIGP